ncbi:MAG TPA: N-formylglutamate amidohydrolase [Alphaproteobacteria bacterium]|nr:N-formylglutamate amidohydrolase [Alphaproteobacteria bacterium]
MTRTSRPRAASRRHLLAADEPAAFELVNESGQAPVLLICDHASPRVPLALRSLGLEEWQLLRHIGWDIGAAEVARALSRRLDAPLVLAGYSRLVIDCNRRPGDASSIPEASDGVAVPGNRGLAKADSALRLGELFRPYHAAIEAALERWRGQGLVPALVAIHSFTPVFEGFERPWHIGVLWDQEARIARPLLEALGRQDGVVVGDNEPYSARKPQGYSVTAHAAAKGYPHVAIEVRQDLIDTHHGAAEWAERLAAALGPILKDGSLYRVEHSP